LKGGMTWFEDEGEGICYWSEVLVFWFRQPVLYFAKGATTCHCEWL